MWMTKLIMQQSHLEGRTPHWESRNLQLISSACHDKVNLFPLLFFLSCKMKRIFFLLKGHNFHFIYTYITCIMYSYTMYAQYYTPGVQTKLCMSNIHVSPLTGHHRCEGVYLWLSKHFMLLGKRRLICPCWTADS